MINVYFQDMIIKQTFIKKIKMTNTQFHSKANEKFIMQFYDMKKLIS